ncbi:MAG: T9SS type A sorting domain-containing protein [Calditrichaeota bacterium]|nr:T9SS type A sorting domain-containing protein [Calditrichota bacterium]
MKRIYIFILLALSPSIFAQPELDLWRLYNGGGRLTEHFNDIFYLARGGYYVCGISDARAWILRLDNEGNIEWQNVGNNQIASFLTVIQADNNDAVVGGTENNNFISARYNPEGEQIWQNEYGRGRCNAVIELKEGNFILAGVLNNRSALICINDDGEPVWTETYGAQDEISSFGMLREAEDGIVAAGQIRQSQMAAPSRGWLIKTNFQGELQWQHRHINQEEDRLSRTYEFIVSNPEGGFIIVGSHSSIYDHLGNARAKLAVTKVNNQGNELSLWIYDFNQTGKCLGKLPDGGLIVTGHIGIDNMCFPLALRLDRNGEELWRITFRELALHNPRPQDDYNMLTSVLVINESQIVACGGTWNEEIARGHDGLIVRLEPDRIGPIVFYRHPEDTLLSILPGDTIQFTVRARNQMGIEMAYHWQYGDSLIGRDTTVLVPFDTLIGDYRITCRVTANEWAAVAPWTIYVRDMYIVSSTPDSCNLVIRRNTVVPFSIDSVAYIDDGRGRPAYRWSLIDRLDDNRREEVGQDSAVDIRFERKGRFAVEGLAYLGDARDSVTWEVEVRGIIRAYWPRCEVVSIRPGEEVAFGVAPFEPEDRRPCLSYRWQVDQVDLVDEDSSEVRLVFPNRGRFEVGVFVVDSVQVDSLHWELAETDSQKWIVNVAVPDWIVHAKFQIPNSKFDIAPNPFNALAEVRFELEQAADVKLQMFDISGRLVRMPVDGWLEAGRHSIAVEGCDLPAGIYIFRLKTEYKTIARKVVLMR